MKTKEKLLQDIESGLNARCGAYLIEKTEQYGTKCYRVSFVANPETSVAYDDNFNNVYEFVKGQFEE